MQSVETYKLVLIHLCLILAVFASSNNAEVWLFSDFLLLFKF